MCVPSASSKVLGNDDACTEEAFAAYQAKAIAAGQVPFGTRLEWKRALFWSATYHHALAPKTMRTIAEIAACYFGVKYFLAYVLRRRPTQEEAAHLAEAFKTSQLEVQTACAELFDDHGDLRLAAAAKAIGLTCANDASEARLVLRVRDYDRRLVDLTVADRDGLIGAVCETILGSERVLPTRGGLVATQRHAREWATDFVDNCLPAYGSRGCKRRLLGARWFQLVLVWEDETELPLCGATAGGEELAAQLGLQYPPQPPLETEKRDFGYVQLTPPPAATSGSGSEVGRLFRASAETRTALESSDEGLACLAVLDVPACRRDALPLLRMHQTDASRA